MIRRQRRDHPYLSELLAPEPTRLLLVAGVLLDLLVGDLVRRSGDSPACQPEGADWVLPDVPLTTGIRCVYDDSSGVGAAVLWIEGQPELLLPRPEDLPALRREGPARMDRASAIQLLRLRHARWTSDNYLEMSEDSELRAAMQEFAGLLVARVSAPLYAGLGLAATDGLRHVANRLVLDFTVAELSISGDLPAPAPTDIRRLVWTGPDWALAADAAGIAAGQGDRRGGSS
jgi:hypothetical protein